MLETQPGVRLIMVITLRNSVQLRAGITDATIRRDRATDCITGIDWTLDEDPLGTSIGWVDVREVVAVHYEREARVPDRALVQS